MEREEEKQKKYMTGDGAETEKRTYVQKRNNVKKNESRDGKY
jgi:hypothetical protein